MIVSEETIYFKPSADAKKSHEKSVSEGKKLFSLAALPHIFIFNLCLKFSTFVSYTAVLGVNICLIFFGWILVISSVLLAYGVFKRQSRLTVPYIFALFEAVLLVVLLEVLPEFIDNFDVPWFLLLNFLIGECKHHLLMQRISV
jgi:hypothetical protein